MINREEGAKLSSRLKRIEGQVRGVDLMVSEGRYCMDILNQTRAIIAGMKKVEDMILSNHLKTCVVSSFNSDNLEDQQSKIEEIITLVSKYR